VLLKQEIRLVPVTSRLKKAKSSEKIYTSEPMIVNKNLLKVHKKQQASLSNLLDAEPIDSMVDLRE